MAEEIREILRTSPGQALADTGGLLAVVALLVGALHLPLLF